MDIVYIYVIGQECGPVKVGISKKPWGRASTIGTSAPFKVELLYCHPMNDREHARRHEQWFHRAHWDKRTSGEWFNIESDEAIESIQITITYEATLADAEVEDKAESARWTQ